MNRGLLASNLLSRRVPIGRPALVSTGALLILAGAAGLLSAVDLTLSPVADTTLFQAFPNNNLGGEPTLISGATASGQAARALLKFDLSAVPPNATAQSL